LLGLGLAQNYVGCGQAVTVGRDEPLASAGTSALGGSGGALGFGGEGPAPEGGDGPALGGASPCRQTECRGKVYACGDCVDNDEDGDADAQDSACLGPCDDDEAGFSTGISNSSAACRQDCYFDGDAGPGNDRCEWSHQCDPLSVAPAYPPSGEMRCAYEPMPSGLDCAGLGQEQPAACLDSCLPLVPNGCDCFGCCELPARSGKYHYVGASGGAACSLEALDDPQACPPCTPVDGCFNECEPCEACVGSPPDPSCEPDAACEPGQPACAQSVRCELGFYCVTGCCVRAPVR
jgi:hypothetical protein